MTADLDPLEQHLLGALRSLVATERSQAAPEATALWRAQVDSRLCDHAARWLQSQQLGYYTIGSAGHESNAAVALALRPTDPALLQLPLRRLLSRAGRPTRS
jgi:2-oxoisovalerate dehydrogenase E1 component